jgi:hypothetical protein
MNVLQVHSQASLPHCGKMALFFPELVVHAIYVHGQVSLIR